MFSLTSAPCWLSFLYPAWPTPAMGAWLPSCLIGFLWKGEQQKGEVRERDRNKSRCKFVQLIFLVKFRCFYLIRLWKLVSANCSVPFNFFPLHTFFSTLGLCVQLPYNSRCWVSVQMFYVYHSSITSVKKTLSYSKHLRRCLVYSTGQEQSREKKEKQYWHDTGSRIEQSVKMKKIVVTCTFIFLLLRAKAVLDFLSL